MHKWPAMPMALRVFSMSSLSNLAPAPAAPKLEWALPVRTLPAGLGALASAPAGCLKMALAKREEISQPRAEAKISSLPEALALSAQAKTVGRTYVSS